MRQTKSLFIEDDVKINLIYRAKKLYFIICSFKDGSVLLNFQLNYRRPYGRGLGLVSVCDSREEYVDDIKDILNMCPSKCARKVIKKFYHDNTKILEQLDRRYKEICQ